MCYKVSQGNHWLKRCVDLFTLGLHQNRDTLLNVMDVFIKEPLLDWRKQAMNEMTAQRKLKNHISDTSTGH